MTNQSVAVVTGSPTGIGFEISLLLAGNGYRTFATMRDSTKADPIKNTAEKEHLPLEVVQMDVDKCESVKNALGKIIDEESRIDILANNVGYGLFGALEDISIEDVRKQYETDVYGVIRTVHRVLPIMRAQRDGTIVNVSSMSGYIGFPASSVCVSTKFALEGLSESLSYEVEPYGIKIILIEPGVINTNFVENLAIPDNTKEISVSLLLRSSSNGSIMPLAVSKTNVNISTDNSAASYPDEARPEKGVTQYSEVVKKFLSHYYPAMNNALHPKEVAIVMLETINASKRPSDRGNNFFRYAVGEEAKFYAEAKRKMTDSELHSLVMKRTIS